MIKKLLILSVLILTSCTTGFQPRVENAVAMFEFGNLGTEFPDYCIEYFYNAYSPDLEVAFYLYEKDEKGYPATAAIHRFKYLGEKGWQSILEDNQEENWKYTWEEGKILGVKYDQETEVNMVWSGEKISTASTFWDGQLDMQLVFAYDENRLTDYSHFIYWSGEEKLLSTYKLLFQDQKLTGLLRDDQLESEGPVREILTYDDSSRLTEFRDSSGYFTQVFFYEAWDQSLNFTEVASQYLPDHVNINEIEAAES